MVRGPWPVEVKGRMNGLEIEGLLCGGVSTIWSDDQIITHVFMMGHKAQAPPGQRRIGPGGPGRRVCVLKVHLACDLEAVWRVEAARRQRP